MCVVKIYFLTLLILHFILFNLWKRGLMFNCVCNMNKYCDIFQISIHGVRNAIWTTIFDMNHNILRYEKHDDCSYNSFIIFTTFSYAMLTKKAEWNVIRNYLWTIHRDFKYVSLFLFTSICGMMCDLKRDHLLFIYLRCVISVFLTCVRSMFIDIFYNFVEIAFYFILIREYMVQCLMIIVEMLICWIHVFNIEMCLCFNSLRLILIRWIHGWNCVLFYFNSCVRLLFVQLFVMRDDHY